jgi:hypothetical protein
MRTSYEVRWEEARFDSEREQKEAVIEYLRSMGCRDHEITKMAADKVTWRGAAYRAMPRND